MRREKNAAKGIAASAEREKRREEIDVEKGEGLGASLQRFIAKQEEARVRPEKNAAKAVVAGAEREKPREEIDGLGASLQRVIAKQEGIEGVRGEQSAAVADYLKPYLKRLASLERALPTFPDNALTPWADIESDVLDPTNPETIREVALRYGTDPKHAYLMSRRRKWTKRRAVIMELHARNSTAKALASTTNILAGGDGVSRSLVEDEEEMVGLVRDCLAGFREAMNGGLIPFRSTGDLDKLIRLMHFVKGRADSIHENRNRIEPKDLEAIASKVARTLRLDSVLSGVVRDAEFEVQSADAAAKPVTNRDRPTDRIEAPKNGAHSSS